MLSTHNVSNLLSVFVIYYVERLRRCSGLFLPCGPSTHLALRGCVERRDNCRPLSQSVPLRSTPGRRLKCAVEVFVRLGLGQFLIKPVLVRQSRAGQPIIGRGQFPGDSAEQPVMVVEVDVEVSVHTGLLH